MVDPQHPAYEKQMRNLQRSRKQIRMAMARWERPPRATYIKHKGYVVQAVKEMPGATSGQVYNLYCRLAQRNDEKPRTYRRVTQLLDELEREGTIFSIMANLGKHGRTRIWEVSRIRCVPLPKWWP